MAETTLDETINKIVARPTYNCAAGEYLQIRLDQSGTIALLFEPERAGLVDLVTSLRHALQDLADACDGVGVKHFDTDDMSPEVALMQSCTQHARAILDRGMGLKNGK